MSYLNTQGKKVAVIGSRDYTNKEKIYSFLDKNLARIKAIVSGGCRGADELGRQYAQDRGLPCLIFYARWYDEDGLLVRGAGFARNYEIVRASDVIVAFRLNKSKGTTHTIETAQEVGKKVIIFDD